MKRVLFIIVSVFLIFISLINLNRSSKAVYGEEKIIKADVFLLDFTDDLISAIGKNLIDIEKENPGKIKYTLYDGKSNQDVQNEQIDKVLDEGSDLILLNIVRREDSQEVINKIKQANIPVILFNREPLTLKPLQSYDKAFYLGTDSKEIGSLQGKMLIDTWNTSRKYVDKNNDGVMQYVMLEGESNNIDAIERTQYSVSTIEEAGIKTELLELKVCDWLEDLAYDAIKGGFLRYGNEVEAIIANDDSMAIGAIKALQEYGYNKDTSDISKIIPVVGVDVTPEAKELIEKGQMLGSVYQGAREYAEALYECGMNLAHGKSPIDGTKYKFDDAGVVIHFPIGKYLYKNVFALK